MAAELSPEGLGGVFHLAVVLRECLFENQTAKRFKTVLSPSRLVPSTLTELYVSCPHSTQALIDSALFVVFSSASSGLGNAGQTNYSFANSSMEHLCELRNQDGLHGLAIRWGAIAEVGILHTIMGGSQSIRVYPALTPSSCSAMITSVPLSAATFLLCNQLPLKGGLVTSLVRKLQLPDRAGLDSAE